MIMIISIYIQWKTQVGNGTCDLPEPPAAPLHQHAGLLGQAAAHQGQQVNDVGKDRRQGLLHGRRAFRDG